MRIIDISWPISNQTTTYKNKRDICHEPTRTFELDGFRESKISYGVHTGTHIDAPAHFIENGKTIDQINLAQLIGKAKVFDLTYLNEKISNLDLEKLDFSDCKIALFKTKNSLDSATGLFNLNFIYLDSSAAQYLTTKNLMAIGIDSLGIERNQPNHETHKILFESNILIIEGLRLDQVDSGIYELICLPLNIVNSDGAPARAILIDPAHPECFL